MNVLFHRNSFFWALCPQGTWSTAKQTCHGHASARLWIVQILRLDDHRRTSTSKKVLHLWLVGHIGWRWPAGSCSKLCQPSWETELWQETEKDEAAEDKDGRGHGWPFPKNWKSKRLKGRNEHRTSSNNGLNISTLTGSTPMLESILATLYPVPCREGWRSWRGRGGVLDPQIVEEDGGETQLNGIPRQSQTTY